MILRLCGNHPSSTVNITKQQQNDKAGSRQQDPGSRSQALEDGPEIQLRFSVREPQLCKMNIGCIIRWSRMALQQETRATALSSSSHLLALPPSVFYSSCFRLSICLFFVPSFVQSLNVDDAKICQKEEEGQEKEKNLYREGKRTGKVGEGRMSAWGAERKLGHEEERNTNKCSGKGVIDFVIFPLCAALTPIPPLDISIRAAWRLSFFNHRRKKHTNNEQEWWNQKVKKAEDIYHRHVRHRKTSVSSYQTELRSVVTLSEKKADNLLSPPSFWLGSLIFCFKAMMVMSST